MTTFDPWQQLTEKYPPAPEAEAILQELRAFNPHMLRVTLSTLVAMTSGVSVINRGSPGSGKSHGSVELLKLLGRPVTEIKGHQTPLDFFKAVSNATGEVIVIDEACSLLQSYEVLNLLLALLWNKRITWREDEAKVNVPVIFNTNWIPSTGFAEALLDRCFNNNVTLTREQLLDKMKSKAEYKPNHVAYQLINQKLNTPIQLTKEEEHDARSVLQHLPVTSMRDEFKLMKCAEFSKQLFGTIANAGLVIEFDKLKYIRASDARDADKVKAIQAACGVQRRQAYNILHENQCVRKTESTAETILKSGSESQKTETA